MDIFKLKVYELSIKEQLNTVHIFNSICKEIQLF